MDLLQLPLEVREKLAELQLELSEGEVFLSLMLSQLNETLVRKPIFQY
jgi:hypothetical protein